MATGVRRVRPGSTAFKRETGQRAEAGGVSDAPAPTAVVGIRAHER